ncbi:MAG: hypothetical protein ABFS41_04185 [Myxococcota bacterium]
MRRGGRRPSGWRRPSLGAALAGLVLLAGCGTPDPDPRYRPTESVLEVVAVLHRHVPDDTYRFPAAEDYTGRNVYRASLLRLENLERAHANLGGGTLDDVIAFAKGRALERLRAFDLAATSYRSAAESGGALTEEALRSAVLCEAIEAANRAGALPDGELEVRLAALDARDTELAKLEDRAAGSHYAAVLQEEREHTQMERARLVVAARALSSDGDVRALSALQQLVVDQRESKLANRHLLALADLYAALAREYVDANPPAALGFDPPRFEDLVEATARLYESVANQDGAPEKLEANQKLESFLAFTLRVDRDRFTP